MNNAAEEETRKLAIRMYVEGKAPIEIYTELGRSKRWFFKWLERYKSNDTQWYQTLSRAPKRVSNKTSEEVEATVLQIRSTLEETKYAQVGSLSIQWEMEKLGMAPLPAWTIDRILKRYNVVREKKRYKPVGKAYPDVKNIFSDSIQQADLVGPRYIKNDGRFYSFNVFDLETYLAAVNPCRTKGDEDVARGLLRSWKTIGLPEYLQMDNELSFRGSNRYPHSLGLVLRMCLKLGVQVIFIPVGEPWRNGIIEKFQDVFDKKFYRGQFFTSFKHLKQEARKFEDFRNKNHRCTGIKGKTPMQHIQAEGINTHKLDRSVSLKKIGLSLADGYIHLVRFVRSNLNIDVFGEKFKMPEALNTNT